MATESWAIREEKEEMRAEKYPRIWCVFASEDWAAEMLVSLVGRIELTTGSTLAQHTAPWPSTQHPDHTPGFSISKSSLPSGALRR